MRRGNLTGWGPLRSVVIDLVQLEIESVSAIQTMLKNCNNHNTVVPILGYVKVVMLPTSAILPENLFQILPDLIITTNLHKSFQYPPHQHSHPDPYTRQAYLSAAQYYFLTLIASRSVPEPSSPTRPTHSCLPDPITQRFTHI
jgi:hypothetical protein